MTAGPLELKCVGSRTSTTRCQTQLQMMLGYECCSYQCPICDTIYLVNPLKADFWRGEEGLVRATLPSSTFGHTVEVWTGPRVHSIRRDYSEAERFLIPVIGSLDRAYTAPAFVSPIEIALAELDSVAQSLKPFRPDQPISVMEQALGFIAFACWLNRVEHNPDFQYEPANETARAIAVQFVDEVLSEDETIRAVRKYVPSFDPNIEIGWALQRANHPLWQASLTRAIIMICRSLAYRYSGEASQWSPLLQGLTSQSAMDTGKFLFNSLVADPPARRSRPRIRVRRGVGGDKP